MVASQRIPIFVDTNVLLRALQHDNPFGAIARRALKTLHRQGRRLCLAPQNIREFWNVCTRPTDQNGLGMSASGAERRTQFLERRFNILPDTALTYITSRQLVAEHSVLGVKVHDAWLAAAMKAHALRFLRSTLATLLATTELILLTHGLFDLEPAILRWWRRTGACECTTISINVTVAWPVI